MSFSRQISVQRAAAVTLLAVYGFVASLGYGLHELIPCADLACQDVACHDAHNHCGHDHGCEVPTAAQLQHSHDHDGLAVKAPGHDASKCAVCALLAKFETGSADVGVIAVSMDALGSECPASGGLLPADLVLSGTSRGPPRA